jgi:hypothetical protein
MLIKNKNRNQTQWTIRFSRSPPLFSQAQLFSLVQPTPLAQPAPLSLFLRLLFFRAVAVGLVSAASSACVLFQGRQRRRTIERKEGPAGPIQMGRTRENGLGRAERKRVGCAGKALFKSFRAETAPSHLHSAKDHP